MGKVIFNRRKEETIKDVQSLSKEEFVAQYAEETTAKPAVLEKFWEESNAQKDLEESVVPAADKPSKDVKAAVKKKATKEEADQPIEVGEEEVNTNVSKKLQKDQSEKQFLEFATFLEAGDGPTDEKLQNLSGDDQLVEAFVEFYGTLEPDTEEEEKRMQTYRHLYDNYGTLIRTEMFSSNKSATKPAAKGEKPSTKDSSKEKGEKADKATDKKANVTKPKAEKAGGPSKRDIIRQIIEEYPECDNKFIKEEAPKRGVSTKIYDSEIYAVRQKLAAEAAAEK